MKELFSLNRNSRNKQLIPKFQLEESAKKARTESSRIEDETSKMHPKARAVAAHREKCLLSLAFYAPGVGGVGQAMLFQKPWME